MQLVMSPASPYVRKVKVMIEEAGLQDRVRDCPVSTTPLDSDPDAVAANPLGRIPALIREDGPAIYDSRVICRYLDDTFSAGLYPEQGKWEVLTLEATAEGLLDSAVSMVYEQRFRGDMIWQPWLDAQWEKVTRALDALEQRWMSHLSGPLHMGQIAVGCALGYLDFRHGDKDWRVGRDALSGWFEVFSARSSMIATAPAP